MTPHNSRELIKKIIPAPLLKWKRKLFQSKNFWADQNHYYIQPEYIGGDVFSWIKSGIVGFKQWYQPVKFSDQLIAHTTKPPLWDPAPELDDEFGIERWNRNVVKHLPNLKGLRVLDVGCNAGLFSLEMAKLGAASVIGIDRSQDFTQKSSPLPFQDVIAQAKFVKRAFELLGNEKLPVEYFHCNFSDLDKLKEFGNFDLILALNVVYHELGGMPKLVETLSTMAPEIIFQASQGHGSPISQWASLESHLRILTEAGFKNITFDLEQNPLDPVIVAKR